MKAYDEVGKSSSSSLELEARALFEAARLLEACRARWDEEGHSTRLGEALRFNLGLWSFFEAELTLPLPALPEDVRLDVLRLSAYVDQRTFEVMAQPEPAKLQVLVEVNRHLALGLTGRLAALRQRIHDGAYETPEIRAILIERLLAVLLPSA